MVRICTAFMLLMLCVAASAQRDPTRPQGGLYGEDAANVVEEGPVAMAAKMVLVGDERKLALVGGRILSEGDEFEGGKIVEITDNGVEVLGADGAIEFLPVQSTQKSTTWQFKKVYRDE